MSGGGGSGSQNTVTQVQQIPAFEQQASIDNQALASSLASQPYPVYQGALIQGFTPTQTQGQNMALNAASSYQPDLNAAHDVTAMGANAGGVNAYSGADAGALLSTLGISAANPINIGQFMSPYVQQALAPSISDLNLQQQQQNQQIAAQATGANAFGDARQGVAQSLNDYYNNQALNQLVGTGYNNAYSQALSAINNAQQIGLGAASQFGQLANLQNTEQNTQLAAGNQFSNLGAQNQTLGENAANATYAVGQQQQTQEQTQLNAAYQQYLNQVNWPFQMLSVKESALSNSPYNIATAVQLPNVNTVGQGLSSLGSLAGMIGGSSGPNVFGAQK